MTKLESCRSMLTRYHDLMSVFAEMDDCLGEMTQTEVSLRTVYSVCTTLLTLPYFWWVVLLYLFVDTFRTGIFNSLR